MATGVLEEGRITAADPVGVLGKLNHYYERLDAWSREKGLPLNPFAPPAAESFYELHNLTQDAEERTNQAATSPSVLSQLQSVLESQREEKRLVPSHRNPT